MVGPKCELPCDRTGTGSKVLKEEESEMLEFRFGFSIKYLCKQHYLDQFSRYKGWQKEWSDPMLRHNKKVKTNLRDINLDFAKRVKKFTESRIVPGQTFSSNCEKALNAELIIGKVGLLNNSKLKKVLKFLWKTFLIWRWTHQGRKKLLELKGKIFYRVAFWKLFNFYARKLGMI